MEAETVDREALVNRAVGYRAAASHVRELIEKHGTDADPAMILVFLDRGAELRERFARDMRGADNDD